MPTQQPKWLFCANLGDVNPIQEGGAFVFRDRTQVYDPELVIFDGFADDAAGRRQRVWTITCTPCTYQDGILSDNKHHPNKEVWWAGELDQVASLIGGTVDKLREDLCAQDVVTRARAYQSLTYYFGRGEFDAYPAPMTRTDIRRRYRGAFRP